MSAAISPPSRWSAARPGGPARTALAGWLRHRLRRAPPGGLAALTLIALLLWSFVGSLGMGLRTPGTSEPRMAWLWLVVALAIAAAGLAGRLLATWGSEE